jgi:phosphatidylglycerol:prolipoprotein diacylglycerol transferase
MWGEFLFGSHRTYQVFVELSVVVGGAVLLFTARAAGIQLWRALVLLLGFAGAALVGAKLYALTEESAFQQLNWGNAFGGFRYPGAIVGILVALPWLWRWLVPTIPLAACGDWLAPAMGFAEVAGRMGCFFAGCCFGVVAHVPWAVRFPLGSPAARFHGIQGWMTGDATASLPVHPLQLYFALLAFALGVYSLWLRPRKQYDGQLLLVFVAVHETGKFLLEFLRAPVAPEASVYLQLSSLLLATPAIALLCAYGMTRHGRPGVGGVIDVGSPVRRSETQALMS